VAHVQIFSWDLLADSITELSGIYRHMHCLTTVFMDELSNIFIICFCFVGDWSS
jgi:hypothetical protein